MNNELLSQLSTPVSTKNSQLMLGLTFFALGLLVMLRVFGHLQFI